MNQVGDAVQASQGGALMRVKVKTGCSHPRFPAGYDPWRKAIGLEVQALPRGGHANREIINTVQNFFDLSANQVRIVYGATSTEKGIWVARQPTDVVARISYEL